MHNEEEPDHQRPLLSAETHQDSVAASCSFDNSDDTIGDKQRERALVARLDKRLLLFAMFSNMVKTMDNVNLGTVALQ